MNLNEQIYISSAEVPFVVPIPLKQNVLLHIALLLYLYFLQVNRIASPRISWKDRKYIKLKKASFQPGSHICPEFNSAVAALEIVSIASFVNMNYSMLLCLLIV